MSEKPIESEEPIVLEEKLSSVAITYATMY